MERNRIVLGVVVVVLLGAGVGAAAVTGLIPGFEGGPTPEGAPPAANESTPTDNSSFAHSIDNVSQCGQVCRLMNTTTRNRLDRTAVNVTLHVRVFADDEGVWQGTTQIGDLAPNESAEATTRIQVGFQGARAIQANDGNVTLITDVRANNASEQFQTESNVN